MKKFILCLALLSCSFAQAGGWQKKDKNVFYPSLFGYKLKNGVSATFMTGTLFGSPLMTFFKKASFGKTLVSSSFWLSSEARFDQGCFEDVRGEGKKITSFSLKATLPEFVSDSLGYGKRQVQMVATTWIEKNRLTSRDEALSEIQIVDHQGVKVDSLQDRDEASPALIDSFKDFTEHSAQCKN